MAVEDAMADPGPVGVIEGRARAVGLSGGLIARLPPLLPQPKGVGGPQASAANTASGGQAQSIRSDSDALGNAGLSPDVDDLWEGQWSGY